MSPKQEQRYGQMKAAKELTKAMAVAIATQYCRENGLSVEKLQKQRFECFENIAWFSQPSGIKPNGLLNDMQTMPFPTLVLKSQDGKLVVEQTEHTRRFLA